MSQEDKIHHNIDKLAVKEAIDEWMDRKWAETQKSVGKWFIRLVALAVFGFFVKMFLLGQLAKP